MAVMRKDMDLEYREVERCRPALAHDNTWQQVRSAWHHTGMEGVREVVVLYGVLGRQIKQIMSLVAEVLDLKTVWYKMVGMEVMVYLVEHMVAFS